MKLINHMCFTVQNMDLSIPFYRDILGLELIDVTNRNPEFSEKVTGIKGAELKIAYFKVHSCAIELIQYLNPPGDKIDTSTNNIGSSHICIVIEDFIKTIEFLKSKNVEIVSDEICIIPAGPNRGRGVIYFHDPDNNTIEYISKEVIVKH